MTDTKIRSRASNRDRSSLVCTVQYSSHTWILAVIRKAWNADTVKDKKQPSSFKYAIMWSVQILHQLHSSSYLFTSWWWFWRFAPCNTNGNVKKKEKKKKSSISHPPLASPAILSSLSLSIILLLHSASLVKTLLLLTSTGHQWSLCAPECFHSSKSD